MKYFVYSRKSVYTGRGESVENQAALCRRYIREKLADSGAEITVYEEEGVSAKDTDRPRFQQMLRDLRLQPPDCVVCYRLDRISRSVSDFSALIEELNRRGVSFVSIREEFDTTKPMGKAMMYMASVFAQLERETIAERVRDNMRLLARTGRWLGGTPPTGYCSERREELLLDGKRKSACRLRENPEELRAVERIYAAYLELRSLSGVARELERGGILSRTGKPYSLPGLRQILQNPVYCAADGDAFDYFSSRGADLCFSREDCTGACGLLAYRKRDYRQRSAVRQPVERWIVAIGRHRGLVEGRSWAAVQRILAENVPTGRRPACVHNGYALLSGLITCGRCGERMFAKRRSGRQGALGWFDYVCAGKLRAGTARCACQNLGGPQTDEMVCRALAALSAEDSAALARRLEAAQRSLRAEGGLPGAQAQRRRIAGEIRRLVEALAQEGGTPALVRRVGERIAELEGQLALLGEEEAMHGGAGAGDAALLASAAQLLPTLSVHEKRAWVRALASGLRWDGETLHLFLRGEGGAQVALCEAAHSQRSSPF